MTGPTIDQPDHPNPIAPRTAERGGGSVSVPMAILILAAAVVIGLAIDGVRAAQGLARADAVAEEAARAAGQAFDPVAVARGTPAVDPTAAVATARAYLYAAGAAGTVEITAPDRVRVRATLTRPTVLLGLLGQPELISTGSAEASLVQVGPTGDPVTDPGDEQ